MIKTIPKKKKCKKAKWLSEEALQIAEKRNKRQRRKGKIENTGFQRTATKHKKAFLNDQCKEIQENNIGKTKDLFKKIRDTKGIFHAKTGTIKERNSIDVTDTEDIKKTVARIHRKTIQKKSS